MFKFRGIYCFLVYILIVCTITMMAGCGSEPMTTVSEKRKETIDSKLLEKDMDLFIYLPKGYSRKTQYPVLYLIHGYGADGDSCFREFDLEKKVDELIESNKIPPMIIVAPSIDNSYGVNSSKKPISLYQNKLGMYEDYICKEVIGYIDSKYSTKATRDGRYIGGFSMGGHVALHLGFAHTDLFSKVGGHSPAIWFEGSSNPDADYMMQWIYPSEQLKKERDPLLLAQDKDLSETKVYLDCGKEDEFKFNEGCEKLNNVLQSKKVNVQYYPNEGNHSVEYWNNNIEKYMLFYGCDNEEHVQQPVLEQKKDVESVKLEKAPICMNDTGKTVIRKMYDEYATYVIVSKNGTVIVADPCGEIGVPNNTTADIITSTHSHEDHIDMQYVKTQDCKKSFWEETSFTEKDIKVSSIKSTHFPGLVDGSNYIYVYEVDGLRIAHMGDIGQDQFTEEQLIQLGKIDVAIMPFYQDYGLDYWNTAKLIEQLKPLNILAGHIGGEIQVASKLDIELITETKFEINKEDLKDGKTKLINLNSFF